MMMIPCKRILRKNVWCDSDEQFITDITEAFNLWIHRVENLHQTNSEANIDPLCSDSQDTNNNNDSGSAADEESLSPNRHPLENLSPINVGSNSGSNDRSNECTAEFGKQDFSVHKKGFNRTSDSNGEVSTTQIPRILHFIWLGSEIPEKYGILINTWSERHASWDVKLWTDEDVKLMILKNQKAYSLAKNWGMKSDILRYEILQKFGGVYIDTDYECLQNIDYLCQGNSFFAGIANTTAVEINNGLLGSCIGHPLLEIFIQTIHESLINKEIDIEKKIAEEKRKELLKAIQQMTILSTFLSAEEIISMANIGVQNRDNGDAMETIRMTGPGMLTKTIFEYLSIEKNKKKESVKVSDKNSDKYHGFAITVFPYTVFNPIPNTCTVDLADREKMMELKKRFIVRREIRSENKDVEGDISLRLYDGDNLIDRYWGDDEKQYHELTTTTANLDTEHSKSSAEKSSVEVMRGRNYFGSAAVHWWQRSWQSEPSEERSS